MNPIDRRPTPATGGRKADSRDRFMRSVCSVGNNAPLGQRAGQQFEKGYKMTEERKKFWNRQGIEVVGQYAVEDWTANRVLISIWHELEAGGFLSKKDDNHIYLKACFDWAERFTDEFRRNGYTFNNLRFFNHKRDKKGKLISCEAMMPFWKAPPTDEQIETHIERQKRLQQPRKTKKEHKQ